MQPNNKNSGLWVTFVFILVVICSDIMIFVTPDKDFSDTENRMLMQFPDISVTGLSDGTCCSDIEKYLSDQFPYRDAWSSISFFTKRKIFGQNEMNGVYIGKDGYLMLIPSNPDPDNMAEKLSAVNSLSEKYSELNHCMAIIPNAVTVMTDKLPIFAPESNQQEQLSEISKGLRGIKFCNVTEALKSHGSEYLYYRTDHHWTSLGAYIAFKSIAPALEIDPNDTEYDVYTVSENFQGTLSSKSGSHGFNNINDKIEIYVPKGNPPLSIKYSDSDEQSGTIYQKKFLDTKDKYALFLGGNHPIVTVTTTADTQRTLLLIKDSYANCFVQFLTPYFDRIIIADPRYCYDSAEMLINEYEVTDLFYLYNADTFMTDTSLTDFLAFESDSSEQSE